MYKQLNIRWYLYSKLLVRIQFLKRRELANFYIVIKNINILIDECNRKAFLPTRKIKIMSQWGT